MVTINMLTVDAPGLSESGAFGPESDRAELEGSRKPRPVIGSGDSCITLAFGRDVIAVGDVVNDWRRCRYSSTVPSPKPIAK